MAITPDAQRGVAASETDVARAGSLADVLDVILDKGLVLDAFIRVSLVGIEILTLDVRIVVASVDTYMHFAREAHRLEMGGDQGSAKQGLAGVMGRLAEGGAHNISRGALRGAGEGLREGLFPPREGQRREGGVVQRAVGAIRQKAGDAIQGALSGGDDPDQEGGSAEAEGAPARQSAPRSTGQQAQAQGAPEGGPATPERRAPRRRAPSSRQAPPRDPRD